MNKSFLNDYTIAQNCKVNAPTNGPSWATVRDDASKQATRPKKADK